MFAIVGAAGKVGFSTSMALREAGVPVRAILRDETKASPLRAIGCEVALADLQDPAALARALAGAEKVQFILPPPPRADDTVGEMRRSIESLAEALQQARPSRVLAISDYGAHVGEGVGMPALFHRFEQRLRRLDMAKLFLRSAEHMEGWALAPGSWSSCTMPTIRAASSTSSPTKRSSASARPS